MVNSETSEAVAAIGPAGLRAVSGLVKGYVALAVATVAALIILSVAAPHLATSNAWGHAVLVAAFAVLLPLRLRAARRGSARALRGVTIIASALLVANVVEAALPGTFPGCMRIEMVVIAVLMALVVTLLVRGLRPSRATNLP